MTIVYGHSDDLVEIEEEGWRSEEIDCYDKVAQIEFKDGTVISIGYPKEKLAVWWIKVEETGTAWHNLTVCNNENDQYHTDVFEIDARVKRVTYKNDPQCGADLSQVRAGYMGKTVIGDWEDG